MRKLKENLWWLMPAVLFFSAVYVWYIVWTTHTAFGAGTAKVAFLDVGQGDAVYIEAPNGNQMMIDGGPGKATLRVLGEVMPFSDHSIDVLLISNPDKDHIGGFLNILERYDIGVIVEPGTRPDTDVYGEFEKAVAREGARRLIARRGMKIILDEEDGMVFEILFPDKDVSDWKTNDGSIIGKLTTNDNIFMLTGGAPAKIEEYLVERDGVKLDADILKISHHGSRTSSSGEFLRAVAPDEAVISVGAGNRYGHPHPEVLERFASLGVKILRTDQQGTIIFKF